jgi:hypothetical protein
MASATKYLGVTPEYLLYKMSYQNLVLYLATAPSYKEDSKPAEEVKDAATLTNDDLKDFYL